MPLSYGMVAVDLTGQGLPGRAMLARRENFNAQSCDVLTLYVDAPIDNPAHPHWQIVPLFENDVEQLTVAASGGAD